MLILTDNCTPTPWAPHATYTLGLNCSSKGHSRAASASCRKGSMDLLALDALFRAQNLDGRPPSSRTTPKGT